MGLAETTLSLHHRTESLRLIFSLHLIWVLKHAANRLISDIQDQAEHLRSLSQDGASLDNVLVIELSRRRIFVELERSLDMSEVVVLIFQKARY